MQINANLSQLIQKVKQLDEKVNSLNPETSNKKESTVKNEKIKNENVNKDKIPKKSNTNDIRTISLQ